MKSRSFSWPRFLRRVFRVRPIPEQRPTRFATLHVQLLEDRVTPAQASVVALGAGVGGAPLCATIVTGITDQPSAHSAVNVTIRFIAQCSSTTLPLNRATRRSDQGSCPTRSRRTAAAA